MVRHYSHRGGVVPGFAARRRRGARGRRASRGPGRALTESGQIARRGRYPDPVRPDRSHWLLAPLFLLPFLVGIALGAWAQRDYGSLRRGARDDARLWAARAVRGPQGGFWRSLDTARPAATLHPATPEGAGALVVLPGSGVPDRWSSWRIGARFPEGPGAEAVADADRRIALETGGTDATAPGAGLFARLYREPDAGALRDAELPASTKLYLLDRLPGEFEGVGVVRAMLRLAAEREALAANPPAGLLRVESGYLLQLRFDPHTTWVAAGSYALFTDPPSPALVLLDGAARLPVARRDVGELWTIGVGDEPLPGAFWSATLEGPVRGVWSLAARYGDSWLGVPRYRRWIPAILGASLAYLAIPIALWVALRRRRLLDAARIRFLTEIAHDLRTPLTAIRLHAELIASKRGNPESGEKYLAVLERESARASDLLGNLLDLSRLERGARRFELEPLDPSETVQSCVEEFRRLHPERAGDLSAEGSAARLRADRTALARCVRNLLDNAAKYTAPGTPIRLRWGGDTIRVEDEGPGVRDPARMFERYVRGANGEGVSGTGLGLSLVRELVTGMGGRIAYRDGGPGAVFEIVLPEVGDA